VLVSSHVLPEVERMAPRVVVLVNGRLVAEGETGAIRDLIRDRPRTVRIAAGAGAQALARELVGEGLATGVHIDTGVLVVETGDVDALGRRLMPIARDLGTTLERVEPLGDDLESVYTYLTDHARGRGR
jgi:ABC-2 type transport system ATP-binding protein